VAPPGFCNRGEVRYGSTGGLEYEVPQSRLYCLCINVALCSTALQCICRVIRRSSMTMKAHTYYIIFGRPPIGGSFPPSPLAAPLPIYHRCIPLFCPLFINLFNTDNKTSVCRTTSQHNCTRGSTLNHTHTHTHNTHTRLMALCPGLPG